MSIQNAINFISTAGQNDALRGSINSLKTDKIMPFLEEEGYKFSLEEFEESINVMHVKCKTEEEANFLFEVVWWFKLACV